MSILYETRIHKVAMLLSCEKYADHIILVTAAEYFGERILKKNHRNYVKKKLKGLLSIWPTVCSETHHAQCWNCEILAGSGYNFLTIRSLTKIAMGSVCVQLTPRYMICQCVGG